MYNSQQKNAFIKIHSEVEQKKITSLFELLEPIEEKLQTDIANYDLSKYGEILFEIIDFKRLTHFKNMYGILLRYHVYCRRANLLNRETYIKYNTELQNKIFSPNITQIYSEQMQKRQGDNLSYLYNPSSLYEHISLYFNDSSLFDKQNGLDLDDNHNTAFSQDRMIILFAMLTYYGLSEDDLTQIKISDDCIIDIPSGIGIRLDNRLFEITDESVVKLIQERQSKSIVYSKVNKNSYKDEMLSATHLMLKDIADEPSVQIERYYIIYRRHVSESKKGSHCLPGYKELKLYGNIYRTSCYINNNIDVDLVDKAAIIKLFRAISNAKAVNRNAFDDIYQKIIDCCNLIKNE
jgi:hypothetical protein